MRRDIYADVSKKYEEREVQKFRKFDEERVDLYERLRAAEEQGRTLMEEKTYLSLDFAFKKWIFATRISRRAGSDTADRMRDVLTGKHHDRMQF